jgi:putative membrane protein
MARNLNTTNILNLNTKIMKKISTALLIATLYIFSACNDTGDKKDSVEQANDANDKKDTTAMMGNNNATDSTAKMTTPVNDDVADFAVKTANAGMTEVELGKLAEEKATSKSVKDFGAMMVKDHTKANEELKSLAAAKNITLPTAVGEDMRKHIDDLSKKTGNDFDHDYIDMMVNDHKDVIDNFEDAAKNSKDSAFKNFAVKTLPTLYKHLGAAKAIVKSRK